MAELIKMVEGGYNLVDKDEVIPAANLIPFGRLHSFPNNAVYYNNVNLLKGSVPNFLDELKSPAAEYAEKMKAPFYELEINQRSYPEQGFFGENLKKVNFFAEAKIQLYVGNCIVNSSELLDNF
jgi:hypothetical protein